MLFAAQDMIELRHLRYFIAVAEELSFRRAAQRIHIDQTPLSRTIRDLEERWGVTLFTRSPRTLQLTPAGLKMLKHSRNLLVRLERAKRAVRATDARHREPLRIGVDESTIQPKLAYCLARWRSSAPEIAIEVVEMTMTEMRAALRNEVIDAGFSFGLPDEDAIANQSVWSNRLVAVLSPEHELAKCGTISMEDLLSFPFIACTQSHLPGLFQQMHSILGYRNLAPTIASEARTLSGYLTRVAVGNGVGLADETFMATLQRNDIVSVPLVERVLITTYVLYKNRPDGLTEELQRFLTHSTTLH